MTRPASTVVARRSAARRAVAENWERPALDSEPYWSVLSWTMCFFAIPMLIYLAWALTRSEAAVPGCVDAAGEPCLAPRAEALVTFMDALPALAGAFALAIIGSVVLRRLTAAWRPSTVAFATAVIGAGLATLVASIIG